VKPKVWARMNASLRTLLAASGGLAFAVVPAARAEKPDGPLNRFHFGAVLGFNTEVNFRNNAATLPPILRPNSLGGTDREYDDGFVRQDASGPGSATTWNWGYDQAAQSGPGGITMNALQGSPGADIEGVSDDPQWGAELTYSRILTVWADALVGLELGFSWVDFNVEDNSTVATSLRRVSDTFGLGGAVPPTAPYAGTYAGPGPLLDRGPAGSATATGGTLSGTRRLEANWWGARLGPLVDIPLGDVLSLQISGGLAVAWFDAEFSYSESATVPGGAPLAQSASASDDEFLWGGYGRAQFTAAFSRRCGMYAGAQYLLMEDFEISAGSRTAEAELGGTLQAVVGFLYQF
jgi:hypothetical protein